MIETFVVFKDDNNSSNYLVEIETNDLSSQ